MNDMEKSPERHIPGGWGLHCPMSAFVALNTPFHLFFNCLHMHASMCSCVPHVCNPHGVQKRVQLIPGIGITGSCELPDMGAAEDLN